MFFTVINKIKLHLKLKNKFLKTKLIKSDFKLLKIFLKLNIINGVKHASKTKNLYIIHINNECAFNNFQNLYRPSKPVKITLKSIIKINKKNTKLFIISTNKGLLNNIEAEKEKVGGILVLNICI